MDTPENSNGTVSRPGITADVLKAHRIRHVSEHEAEILAGHRRREWLFHITQRWRAAYR